MFPDRPTMVTKQPSSPPAAKLIMTMVTMKAVEERVFSGVWLGSNNNHLLFTQFFLARRTCAIADLNFTTAVGAHQLFLG